MKSLVGFYNKLINPKNEFDKDIRQQLEYLNKLEVNVATPFLMKVYEDFDQNIITKDVFINLLNLIQSFVLRRFIVGLQTNALNKIFMSLYDKVSHEDYLCSIQKALLMRSAAQRFPKDKEVIEHLRYKDLYNIKPKNRTYFFERLENYENKERVLIETNSDITVEHIFPRSPSAEWGKSISKEEYEFIKDNYLNSVGNLTLSGNNLKLGNKSFVEKRDMPVFGYKESRLWLNKYLSEVNEWNQQSIEKRFSIISERVLKIWPYPDIDFDEMKNEGEVNIFDAELPTYKKLEYAIFCDQKLTITQVSSLYTTIMSQLFELHPETFFTTELSEKLNLTKDPQKNGIRQPVSINNNYFIEGNFDSAAKFMRIKLALELFDMEDELTIKYAS